MICKDGRYEQHYNTAWINTFALPIEEPIALRFSPNTWPG
jgi:hypothetical protein